MSWLSSRIKNTSTVAFLAFSSFFWACLIFIFAPALPVGMGLPVPDYNNLFNTWSWIELFEGLCGEKTLFLSPLFPLGLIASTQWGMELLWLVTSFCGGLSMAFFLRTRGVSDWSSYGGGLLFGFIGYMFTLFSAGHATNAMTWAFVALPFAFLNQCLERRRLIDFVLLGASMAWCMPQSDVWLLFMYLLSAYGLWRTFCLWRSDKKTDFLWKLYPKFIISVVVVFAVGGAHIKNEFYSALAGREQQFAEASTLQPGHDTKSDPKIEAQKKQERWIFSTNWSLPPEDALEFIVPGIFGDTSFQPPYPYWGRLGQPADFQKGRMMPNYRQHSVYMGGITILLALIGLLGWRCARRAPHTSSAISADAKIFEDVPFFGIAFFIIVIVAMGRYTPVYQGVYHALPFMKTMRCPVKFLHVAELCLATLAGFGIEALIRNPLQKVRPYAWRIAVGLAAGLLVLWLIFISSSTAWTRHIQDLAFFGNSAPSLVNYSLSNIVWAFVRMVIAAALLFWLARQKEAALMSTLSRTALALLIAWGTLDLAVAAKRYVTPINLSAHYASNSLVTLLKAKTRNQSANIINYVTNGNEREDWLSASLRIHGYFNMAPNGQDPQQRALYEKYQADPLKYWEIKGVRFLLVPRKNIQPLAQQGLVVIHGDFQLQNQSIRTCPPQENSIVLAEVRAYASLPALYSQWQSVPAEDQVRELQNKNYITGIPLVTFTHASAHTAQIPPRSITFDAQRRHVDVWTTRGTVANVATPSLLVFNEPYSKDLMATINGAAVPVGQANGQWAAILVPAGGGVVTLSHCGPSWLVLLSACSTLFVLLGVGIAAYKRV